MLAVTSLISDSGRFVLPVGVVRNLTGDLRDRKPRNCKIVRESKLLSELSLKNRLALENRFAPFFPVPKSVPLSDVSTMRASAPPSASSGFGARDVETRINIQPSLAPSLNAFPSGFLRRKRGSVFEWTLDRRNVSYSCPRGRLGFPARIVRPASTFATSLVSSPSSSLPRPFYFSIPPRSLRRPTIFRP